ncbi:HDL541Wp [Eremothecium sinecaudum]|uniref:HDL541Wp n=1 Tax=Eremothecium sinecaudum TaxID=45286 RepID=A0A109UYL2_9SACH|nr:HDL541Wp [Eremothecium sinecaudum]AMD20203.1 HDL541Wp [Eremothecium sinecaudum]
MAGKSDKKTAAANSAVLTALYKYSMPVLALTAIRSLIISKDSVLWYLVLHLPAFLCIYVLEKTGRPKYDERGKVTKVGIELSQSGGLTGVMFDMIYTALFCDLMKLLFNTNGFWYVMFIWPFYWAYQLYFLKKSIGKTLGGK